MNRTDLYNLAKDIAPKLLEISDFRNLEAAIVDAANKASVDPLDVNELKRYVLAERNTLMQLQRAPLPSEAKKRRDEEIETSKKRTEAAKPATPPE